MNDRRVQRRGQARQGSHARSVRRISRQDWDGSRAARLPPPQPWVPARIGARRNGDRERWARATGGGVRRLSGAVHRHASPADGVAGSSAWIGRGLSCVCAKGRENDARRLSFEMSPIQTNYGRPELLKYAGGANRIMSVGYNERGGNTEIAAFLSLIKVMEECLQRLQNRIEVPYDNSNKEHQEALKALWHASFPDTELLALVSDQWKEMGWQGKDPSTDFRGGGFISLENLLYFSRNYPKSFRELLCKQNGDRALWEYPFAVAGVNITFMLIQMLDLEGAKPTSLIGAVFLNLLIDNDKAFDILYCIAFMVMDQKWLDMHATYMEFNKVIKSTRRQLERELLLEDIQRIEDMPSYRFLAR